MLEFIAQSALEVEMTEHLGTGSYERTEERASWRNGYKPRIPITAVGDLHLLVPQDRDGTFRTSPFERYQQKRQDPGAGAHGDLRAGRIHPQGGRRDRGRSAAAPSPASSSRSSPGAWPKRCPTGGAAPSWAPTPTSPWTRDTRRCAVAGGSYPRGSYRDGDQFLWYARDPGGGDSRHRERNHLVGSLPRLKEKGPSGRGAGDLRCPRGHPGGGSAPLPGVSWQRCQFHFIRNLLPLAVRGQKQNLHADLRAIFDSEDPETLDWRLQEISRKWEAMRTAVVDKIDEEITDALACFCFPCPHHKRIRTTNALERLNQEIKRRTRVVRIFPDPASALLLIATLAMEQTEDWDRMYPGHEPAGGMVSCKRRDGPCGHEDDGRTAHR